MMIQILAIIVEVLTFQEINFKFKKSILYHSKQYNVSSAIVTVVVLIVYKKQIYENDHLEHKHGKKLLIITITINNITHTLV